MIELGRFHHVGVAVASIQAAAQNLAAALGASPESDIVHDPQQGVRVQFLQCGGLRIELLEPAASPSPLDSILKRGIAMYQVCYEVNDLDATLTHLRQTGSTVVSPPKPAIAFGNRRIAFVLCEGMLVELLESEKS